MTGALVFDLFEPHVRRLRRMSVPRRPALTLNRNAKFNFFAGGAVFTLRSATHARWMTICVLGIAAVLMLAGCGAAPATATPVAQQLATSTPLPTATPF